MSPDDLRDVLIGEASLPPSRNDRHPLDTLLGRSMDPAIRDVLAPSFAALLTDADVRARSASVLFFLRTSGDDGGRLSGALADEAAFVGDDDPWYGEGPVRPLAIAALAKRLQAGDPDVALVRDAATKPGANRVVARLATLDRAWVVANAGSIVAAAPTALDPLLWNFRNDAEGAAAIVDAAAASVAAPQVKAAVRSAVAEPLRAQLLARL